MWGWGLRTDSVLSLSPCLAQRTPVNNNNNYYYMNYKTLLPIFIFSYTLRSERSPVYGGFYETYRKYMHHSILLLDMVVNILYKYRHINPQRALLIPCKAASSHVQHNLHLHPVVCVNKTSAIELY